MVDIFRRRAQARGLETPRNSAPPTRLEELARDRASRAPDAREIHRIASLPLWTEPAPEEVEQFNRENVLAGAYEAGFRLFPAQVSAVMAYDLFDGGFFPIGVGHGKTAISLMIAQRAYEKGTHASLLMIPPQVYAQLTERDIPWARRRVNLSVPFIGLGNLSPQKRMRLARAGQRGCYILPYSLLSVKDTEQLLELIRPELLIADEAHNLKNSSAARTRRIRRYMDHVDNLEMVAMSGTITSKSITDYWHLIRACLQEHSPLPNSTHLVRHWAQVLDAQQSGSPFSDAQADAYSVGEFSCEPIMPLVYWARKKFPDGDFPETIRGFRRAYRHRLQTAPGVVVTGDASIGTSLVFRNVPAPYDKSDEAGQLERLIEGVKEDWVTPDGDEIDYAIHMWKWLYELSAGFYSSLYWPEPETLVEEARGHGASMTIAQAEEILERARHHHALLQEYHADLRRWLASRQRPGLDTPMLVGSDMLRNGARNVGEDLFGAWKAARDADFPGRPERRSKPVRVYDYKIRAAVQWAQSLDRKHPGGILWVHHQEIGRWTAELLREAGLDVLHCPAGTEANRTIVDPANRRKLVVASVTAHGTGKNLQHFRNQLFVQWPRSAVVAEQAVGRTHRTGQEADELAVCRMDSNFIDRANFAACVNDAVYIHATTGVRQKLMLGSYDPPPVVFSPEVLRRAGLEAKRLTGEQMDMLREKFGDPRDAVS